MKLVGLLSDFFFVGGVERRENQKRKDEEIID
jgi:hypothetical protein